MTVYFAFQNEMIANTKSLFSKESYKNGIQSLDGSCFIEAFEIRLGVFDYRANLFHFLGEGHRTVCEPKNLLKKESNINKLVF